MTQRLPYALQKQGCLLLQQQCWLWGQDIRRPVGNLLLQYGFHRQRPPATVGGCSQYTLPAPDGNHLRLWGFGVYYGAEEGVYLNRYAFRPLSATPQGAVWTAESFCSLTPSQDFAAVATIARLIATYESHVLRSVGTAYRCGCLIGMPGRSLPPADFLRAWRQLATQLETFAGQVAAGHNRTPASSLAIYRPG